MATLTIEIQQHPQATVARLNGEAGLEQADELGRSLNLLSAARPTLAVLDLSGMSYIASMGIGAVVRARNEIAHAGGRVVLAGPTPLVLDTFRHAGLLRMFQVFPTVDDAIRLGSVQAPAVGSASPSSRIAK